jgi:ribonuclease P protein component
MAMKHTYQPKKLKRARKHGYRSRTWLQVQKRNTLGPKHPETPPVNWAVQIGCLVLVMLAKKLRLNRYQLIKTKSSGHRFYSPNLSVIAAENQLAFDRYAVVTSAKLDKRAVVRNKLRRQIYEVVKSYPGTGWDIILYPKPGMLKLSYAEIGIELYQILSKQISLVKRAPGVPV